MCPTALKSRLTAVLHCSGTQLQPHLSSNRYFKALQGMKQGLLACVECSRCNPGRAIPVSAHCPAAKWHVTSTLPLDCSFSLQHSHMHRWGGTYVSILPSCQVAGGDEGRGRQGVDPVLVPQQVQDVGVQAGLEKGDVQGVVALAVHPKVLNLVHGDGLVLAGRRVWGRVALHSSMLLSDHQNLVA